MILVYQALITYQHINFVTVQHATDVSGSYLLYCICIMHGTGFVLWVHDESNVQIVNLSGASAMEC